MKYSIIYILCVVGINLAFSYIPPVFLSDGTIWSVGSVVAGAVFVARDYAQREVGHRLVVVLMFVAAAVSYLMAAPFVALASVMAFGVSEVIDYLTYTLSKLEFKKRVALSSLLSVPVDTFVFLHIIDSISLISFMTMTISKLAVVAFLFMKS